MLWVPATDTTMGYINFYFNRQQYYPTQYWPKWSASMQPPLVSGSATNGTNGGTGNAGNVLDTRHLYLMVSGQIIVSRIEVWQISDVNNIHRR
jgi:hypothetical protein